MQALSKNSYAKSIQDQPLKTYSRPTQELNTPKYISKNQIYSAIEKQRQMHRLSKSLHLPFILTLLPLCALTSASYDAISVVIVNFTIFYPPSFPSYFRSPFSPALSALHSYICYLFRFACRHSQIFSVAPTLATTYHAPLFFLLALRRLLLHAWNLRQCID